MYRSVSPTGHITRRVPSSRLFPPAVSPPVPLAACSPRGPSFTHSVHDILQIVLRNRKSWKTLKGHPEAVWPPYLEATMLNALQQYEPDDSRETRLLGRYPMRNRFISGYIHRATGKYRSPKQVGSRLQQLRDTPEGRQLIDQLTRCDRTGTCNAWVPECHPAPWDPSSSPPFSAISYDSSSSSSSPGSPSDPAMSRLPLSKHRQPAESRTPIYIDILPELPAWSWMAYGPSNHSHPSAALMSGSGFRPLDAARHIRDIDPTVTFVSPSPVNGKSSYIVLLDGAPVHSEDTKLEHMGPYYSSSSGQSSNGGPVLYNTALVPKYWDVLCEAADPTLYTIIQDVYRVRDPLPNQDYSQRPRPALIFSAIYHFQYPSSTGSASTPSYSGQPSVGVPSTGSSMTAAFNDQMLHGSTNPSRQTPLHMHSTYTAPTAERPRASSEAEQNLFDEPFMLDINFEQIAFDEYAVHTLDGTSPSALLFPKDANTIHTYAK